MFQNISPNLQIMGIVNATPDSFYDGGRPPSQLADYALRLIDEGADWIDIGGESTRPGAREVGVEDEIVRVVPVLREIKKARPGAGLSIDTRKSRVALAALDCGAEMVNDVSGLGFDPEMASLVAMRKCKVIIMHSRGTPETMQNLTQYNDVANDVKRELAGKIEKALKAGVSREQILIDPGFGFAKTAEQNLKLLGHLSSLKDGGFPVVVGLSRKSFLGKITGAEKPCDRLEASLASALLAVLGGADMLRVHDVKETRKAWELLKAVAPEKRKS